MKKIILSFFMFWHNILDITLTYIISISFFKAGLPAMVAIFVSLDSILKISLSVFLSRFVLRFSYHTRSKASAFLRLILIGIWFFLMAYLKTNYLYITGLFFVFFKLISLIDTYLSAEFIFSLREHFSIDVSQSAAAQNILLRAANAVAPALALLLISESHIKLFIFSVAVFLYILSTFFLRKVFFPSSFLPHITAVYSKKPPLSFRKIISNPLMQWGLLYQICANFSFAGVTFMFLSKIRPETNAFLNEITLIYISFFVVQLAVLLYGEKIIPASKPLHAAFLMGMCAICMLISSVSDHTLQLLICVGIGLTYSFSLSATQKVVTSHLQGQGFVEYIGLSPLMSRPPAFVSTMGLGLAISLGFSVSTLLTVCGSLGLLSAIVLAFMCPASRPIMRIGLLSANHRNSR